MDNIELLVTITIIEYKLVTGCETVSYVFPYQVAGTLAVDIGKVQGLAGK